MKICAQGIFFSTSCYCFKKTEWTKLENMHAFRMKKLNSEFILTFPIKNENIKSFCLTYFISYLYCIPFNILSLKCAMRYMFFCGKVIMIESKYCLNLEHLICWYYG